MSTQLYWDAEKHLIMAYDPACLTSQQKANIMLLQSLLDTEFGRGFRRGYQVAYAAYAGDGRSKKRPQYKLDKMGPVDHGHYPEEIQLTDTT